MISKKLRNRPSEMVKPTGGCIRCKKAKWVRSSCYCGRTRLTQKQLFNKNGYCSEFEEKQEKNNDI